MSLPTEDRIVRIAGSIAAVLVLYLLKAILISFLVAMGLACVLNPLVDKLTRRLGWPRGITVASIAIGVALVLGLLSYLMVPVFSDQVRILATEAPGYVRAAEQMLSTDPAIDIPAGRHFHQQVLSQVEKYLADLLERSVGMLMGFASRLHYLVVVPILVFYMVKDAPGISRRFYAILPARYREDAAVLLGNCYTTLYSYIYGQIALSAIAGALTTVGLMALGMPNALMLGAASGVVEAIPYLGPIAAGTVAALIALPQGPSLVLKVVALYITIRLLIDLVIGPRVLGQALRLHPLTVLFAILVGGHLLGIVGFFVAPPVAAMATPVVDWVFGRKLGAEEVSTRAGGVEQVVA